MIPNRIRYLMTPKGKGWRATYLNVPEMRSHMIGMMTKLDGQYFMHLAVCFYKFGACQRRTDDGYIVSHVI